MCGSRPCARVSGNDSRRDACSVRILAHCLRLDAREQIPKRLRFHAGRALFSAKWCGCCRTHARPSHDERRHCRTESQLKRCQAQSLRWLRPVPLPPGSVAVHGMSNPVVNVPSGENLEPTPTCRLAPGCRPVPSSNLRFPVALASRRKRCPGGVQWDGPRVVSRADCLGRAEFPVSFLIGQWLARGPCETPCERS